MEPLARLTRTHMALADPTRVRIFDLVAARPRSVREVADAIGIPPDRLYYHLQKLVDGGLLRVAELRQGTDGRAERVYQISPGILDDTAPAADTVEEHAVFLGAILEATRNEVERTVRGATAAQPAVSPVLCRRQLALAPSQFERLVQRMTLLLEEFACTDGGDLPVRVMFTAYPTPAGGG